MSGNFFKSSIGRKYVMAITGLGFSLFVLSHMAGNLLLFVGPKAYNTYAHVLTSNPLIYVAELGLVALFLGHVGMGIKLSFENFRSRESRYAAGGTSGEKKPGFASNAMIFHGLILAVFIVLHVGQFKYGTHYDTVIDGVKMRDLFKLVVETFHKTGFLVWYGFSMILLGLHLSHGFASSFKSMGVYHPTWVGPLKKFGYLYSVVVSAGFIAPPLYIFLNR